ncbi:hypothetical protein O3G_MSEX008088 [Manduca sexta]|uniref:DUF4795 domain-containing protein n=1 Tax=Manduca sexta TaxID=7130 RepID=A0A922CPE1_MANSE|nr:hypothetical protein O3G_MSEX008088 [Manduca sexta]
MAADETAVLLNISDMIDLAIGTPEVGVVDFNMLQTVLHCLAQQLRVLGKNVELRGSVATLPVGRENNQTIAISEFVVDTDDKAAATKTEIHPSPSGSEPPTILVVERVKKTDSPTRSPPRDRSPGPQPHGAGAGGAAAGAPHALSSTERLSLVTLSKFNLLESAVEDLKNRVYGSMPKNEEILEEVRSQTNLKAITDMWTSLNVSSRLEAAEAGISKLSSLVQDVISETSELQEALKKRSSKTQVQTTEATAPTAAGGTAGASPDLAQVQANLDQLRADVDQLSNTFYRTMAEAQAGFEQHTSATSEAPGAAEAVGTTEASTDGPPPEHVQRHAGSSALNDRINALEKRMRECCDKIGAVDGVVQDNINSFQDQLEHMMKQVATLESGGAAKMTPDVIKDLQGLMQLFQTVQEMQDQLKQVHETALQLAAEKEDRQIHVNALLEQIELLKTVKLDREDMVEAMADKADLRMLARKVSHDQFELACDDLSRGLEHALGKLNMQEALWQQALDDIQREIETKLDKMELSPVKDFFNNKLKQLQENLKQMSSLRREAEAAGTKRRLLRDVNCISCDAKAVMPMEAPSSVPVSKPMPATLSMKPYLSYELDAIRKTQASNIPQRNMRDWETIDKQANKLPAKTKSDTDKHLCNRYCGGSHTVTTPAQRVARLGHFIKQWGPDVLPLSSGLATGDDGRMYKVTATEAANVGPGGAVDATCTPKTPVKKVESPKPPPPKPIPIVTECRCLEGDQPQK